MPTWRDETRQCACGVRFTPKRQGQFYHSTKCRVRSAVQRLRLEGKRSDYKPASLPSYPRSDYRASRPRPSPSAYGLKPYRWPEPPSASQLRGRLRNGLINGIFANEAELAAYQRDFAQAAKHSPLDGKLVLLGDDYQLEYYEDG